MSRAATVIRHDDVTRMVKAVKSAGIEIGYVEFDGERVRVFPARPDEQKPEPLKDDDYAEL